VISVTGHDGTFSPARPELFQPRAPCIAHASPLTVPAPQAEGTQGGAPNGIEKSGFFPAENAVFVTSSWVGKEGVQLIDDLFLGKMLGAGMQVWLPKDLKRVALRSNTRWKPLCCHM
jgi:hypothetical protein